MRQFSIILMCRRLKILFLVLLPILSMAPQIHAKKFTVVLDAGHGGKDVGALGKQSHEKDINLGVVLKLGKRIEREMKDIKVVYTRKTDKFVSLQDRADIANKADGDLFISVHTNSVDLKVKDRTRRRGASTYTLGMHRNEDNLAVAKRENSVISLEKDKERYEGFDPNSTESYIIFEISQNRHVEQSVSFAQMVQREFVKTAKRADKSVRQAGFWVLAKTSMPAVLLELDYICNPTEEAYLASEKGQDQLAKAVFNAFSQYKQGIDGYIDGSSNKKNDKESDIIWNDDNAETDPIYLSEEVAIEEERQHASVVAGNQVNNDGERSDRVYKVQFLAMSKKLPTNHSEMKGLKNVEVYRENGLYKYTCGCVSDEKEALSLLNKVRQKFSEAFIVVFENGRRVKE